MNRRNGELLHFLRREKMSPNTKPLWRSLAQHLLPPTIALTAAFLFWEIYVSALDIDALLAPAPTGIWQRFWADPGFFLGHGGWTLYEALLGLLLGSGVAFGLAVITAHSPLIERAVLPIAILVKVTPVVAVAPIFVLWFGLGTIMPTVIVAALISFFPVLVNSITGLRSVSPSILAFFQSLDASDWQVFLKLRFPSMLPYLFTALKIALPLAIIGAVVAEWFSGDRGLGLVILTANSNLDTKTMFAAVAVLAFFGVSLNLLLSLIERRLLHWHEAFRGDRRN